MDILHLVDRLEELFNNSRPIPLSRSVVVDENAFMDIIDQMRISIPDDIKKSQQINAQKDRILAQAQEEANRTLALARDKSEKMIEKARYLWQPKPKPPKLPSKPAGRQSRPNWTLTVTWWKR